jgi:caffeoyl-CoA O-methyltransferase
MNRRVVIGSALAGLAGALAGACRRASPLASAAPGSNGSGGPHPVPGAPPLPAGPTEQTLLGVINDVGEKQRAGNMLVPEDDGRLLRVLSASIGARHVVEIGTSVGYSGLWFALALMTTGGRLTTFDIDPERIEHAKQNFARAGVAGQITTVLGDAHDEVQKVTGPIDLLFLDADKQGYLDYLQKLRAKVRPNGLIVAHNMVYPTPDPRFIAAITRDSGLETVFLNMHAAGIAVTLKKA